MTNKNKPDIHKADVIKSQGFDYTTITGIQAYYENLDGGKSFDPFDIDEEKFEQLRRDKLAEILMQSLPIVVGLKRYTQYLALKKYDVYVDVVADYFGLTRSGIYKNVKNAEKRIESLVAIVENKSLDLDTMYSDLAILIQRDSDFKQTHNEEN